MKMLCDLRTKMNKTLVIITHDPHIAELADRRFTIVDGILTEVAKCNVDGILAESAKYNVDGILTEAAECNVDSILTEVAVK